MLKEEPDKLQLCVNRTLGGTIFEGITAILLLIVWVANIRAVGFAFTQATLVAGMDTLLCILSLNAAYHPLSRISMPINITTTAQLIVMVTYARITAVGLALLGVGISVDINLSHWPNANLAIMYVAIGIMAVNALYCIYRVYTLRDRSKKIRWKIFK